MSTEDGHIIVADKRYPYGQFVQTAAGLVAPTEAPLKPQSAFRYIGRESTRVDALAKSNGSAVFGIDVDLPDMHYAVVKRSPVAGAKLVSFDASKTLVMPGVTDVIEIGSGVAVVAEQYWQAKTAAEALTVEWETVALSKLNSAAIRADYQAALAADDAVSATDDGDVEGAVDGCQPSARRPFTGRPIYHTRPWSQ
jgi:CO/xanthine dehydrogenase Mo-binding subunit